MKYCISDSGFYRHFLFHYALVILFLVENWYKLLGFQLCTVHTLFVDDKIKIFTKSGKITVTEDSNGIREFRKEGSVADYTCTTLLCELVFKTARVVSSNSY